MSSLKFILKIFIYTYLALLTSHKTIYAQSVFELKPQLINIITKNNQKTEVTFRVKSLTSPIYFEPQVEGSKSIRYKTSFINGQTYLLSQNETMSLTIEFDSSVAERNKNYIYKLLVKIVDPIKNNTDQLSLSLEPQIESVVSIYVTDDGQISRNLSLVTFANKNGSVSSVDLPQEIVATVLNKGNITEVIYPTMEITEPNGRIYVANAKPKILAPGEQYEILDSDKLKSIQIPQDRLIFGKYTAKLRITTDNPKYDDVTATTSFYILPSIYLILFVMFCIVAICFILAMIALKSHAEIKTKYKP